MFKNNKTQKLPCPKCGNAMKLSEDISGISSGTSTTYSGWSSSTASVDISQTNSYVYVCPKCGTRIMSDERLLGSSE